jgi:hypothetical protein
MPPACVLMVVYRSFTGSWAVCGNATFENTVCPWQAALHQHALVLLKGPRRFQLGKCSDLAM